MDKLTAYYKESGCPKCASYHTAGPWWHRRGLGGLWFNWIWPMVHWCAGYTLDHLHHACHVCGAKWATACADIREEISK